MFYPESESENFTSRIQGVKKHRILDPDPQHWSFYRCLFIYYYLYVLKQVKSCRVPRLDRAQENLHFLIDICENFLYILETDEHEVI
jgi:hypothetical protein